ncbi:MAG: hypothetical protein HY707_08985 [Ignavibacteriae bacterium]|nr:hypothetical protein [Ignavibacteriota bacterium]
MSDPKGVGVVVRRRLSVILISLCVALSSLNSQEQNSSRNDSTMVFGTITQPLPPIEVKSPRNSWGVDLLVSNGGFGLGTFYRHEYSDHLSGFIDFSISESKDEDEKDYVNIFGVSFTPGKVNRFLVMPLYVGVQRRLFKDDIMDNFRPYLNAAAGPTLIYVFPYNEEYFKALGRGHPEYTFGGYVGIGAFFGSERASLLGLNLRYYFVPYPAGIESLRDSYKKQFGGFYITVNFGSSW